MADLATQAAAFGAMGALFLGSTRVATDTARSMLERGSSGMEAFWGSMAVGTVNMLIYEYGVGELMKLSGPADTSTLTGMLDGALKRAGVTATAGATNEMSKILIDTAIMGHSSEFDLDMKRLRMEGMSAEEAWKHTFSDYVERVMDKGMRSGRYGLIAGLSEYGGAYFEQHPEAFNALVNGKTSWNGNMQGLRSGDGGLLGLPQGFNSGSNTSGMPILPGPAVVKDDWETALEEAVAEQGVEDPENVDISGENGIIIERDIGGMGQTTLEDWADHTGELAKTSPIKIPENSIIKSSTKAAGYDQISYKWAEGGYTYEARWHTKTPGAPTGQGNTWVVSRVTQGTPSGQRRVVHIMVGNTWITRYEWQAAITAYQNGMTTAAQEAMLRAGHWLAP